MVDQLTRAAGVRRRCLAVAALTLLTTAAALPAPSTAEPAPRWTGTWETAPSGTAKVPSDATIRNVVHLSVGGRAVRVRVSNRLGADPLRLDTVTVALRRSGVRPGAAAAPGSLRTVTFGGATSVTVPAGEDRVGDAVELAVPADADLLVSVHTPRDAGRATYHRDAFRTSYLAEHGNRAADVDAAAYTATVSHWYYVTGVDVLRPGGAGSVVAFGDSLTDGTGSTPDTDHRWPDLLSARLRGLPPQRRPGVLNAGISGNRLLREGAGPSALTRFDADATLRDGVRTVIVLEGVNDLKGKPPETDAGAFARGYRRLVARAHTLGIRVIGATLTPFAGYRDWTPAREDLRQEINGFIRNGPFDAVADFDAVVRDPAHPDRILPAYDPGDHLHFDDAGAKALADSIDLTDLLR
ncbi:SGNH/GDSL hydrolase family protein [Streptomyces sp. NPDC048664]|uniref:SGNH/GDSL hydrolase family protein n=1 Tax=Streptomyces sp. NPDC048664 TaxID=3154505 RepID=UPI00341CFFFD